MIVIGDVHGRFDLLQELLIRLPQTKDICFVGDLIDRGHQSKEVLELVKEKYQTVMGNHEHMSLRYRKLWYMNGGKTTLNEFNYEWHSTEWPEWIKSLPLYIEWTRKDGKKFLISHSFANDGINTKEEDLLWDRDWEYGYEEYDRDIGYCNIFGHTPHPKPIHLFNKHWCIDTGAYQTNILTAIDLETETFYTNKDKI